VGRKKESEVAVANNGLMAAFLSALVPGLGQGYLGRWKRAVLFSAPLLLGAAISYSILDISTSDLIGYAVRPTVLKSVLIINLVIVIWRVLAITDAFSLVDRKATWWRTGIVAALCLGVTLPHMVVTQMTLDAAYALDEIFVGEGDRGQRPFEFDADELFAVEELLPAAPDPKLSVPRYQPQGDRPRASLDRFVDLNGLLPLSSGDLTEAEPEEGMERITILLAGGDGGPGRSGSRTDSINVVTFDPTTGKSAVFGIPRNMTHVPLPREWSIAFTDLEKRLTPWAERRLWTDEDEDGEPDQFVPCYCFPDQINAIYPFTREWVDTYPNEREPGLAALRDVVEIMLGIDIDYYAFVNMNGFVNVVNALGGVNVYVTRPVSIDMSPAKEGDEWQHVEIGTGWRKLNGIDALGYVRERRSSSDYTRMQRQRCLLRAVVAKATPGNILTRLSKLSRAMANSAKTDIPLSELPTLLDFAASLELDDIETVGFVPPFYTPVLDFRGNPTPDLLRIQEMVQSALSADADTVFATGKQSECRV
jgi:LCP family protein required for cell wall assembly